MRIVSLKIPDVLIIEPMVFKDNRGLFYESFNQLQFEKALGHKVCFVQDNQSISLKGVLRGMHYQLPPNVQGKLIRVVHGEVFDVAVDLRKSSATFGKWVGEVISAENKKQIWIPEGFAHGFLTLSETAIFLYKTTNYYSKTDERSIRWNDEIINIKWPTEKPLLSTKDEAACSFKDAICFD
jgi:dTDP-4-dehydrorhamnose 3,5-epimerase